MLYHLAAANILHALTYSCRLPLSTSGNILKTSLRTPGNTLQQQQTCCLRSASVAACLYALCHQTHRWVAVAQLISTLHSSILLTRYSYVNLIITYVFLQALPATHPVQKVYAADLASRQQLAAISGDALLAAGAVKSIKSDKPTNPSSSSSSTVSSYFEERAAGWKAGDPAGKQPGAAAAGLEKPQRDVNDEFVARNSYRRRSLKHLAQQQQQQQLLQAPDVQQQQQPKASAAAKSRAGEAAGASGGGVRQYTCNSWKFELDEAQGEVFEMV
jgi:hypothetical protein